jgi:hypothetical protein
MSNCQHVKTQADLDRLLAEREQETEATNPDARLCIHVDGDAEPAALEWAAAQKANVKINGKW